MSGGGTSGTVTLTNAGVTSNVAGNLIDVSGATGAVTVNVDLSELTDGTAPIVGSADELVYLDDGLQKRKLFNEVGLDQFSNADSGFTTNTGDITGVTFTTDDANEISDTAGSADFSILGGEGIDTTSTGSDITITGENASATNKGVVELATTAEADTGTDTARAITAAGLESHVSARYHYQYVHFIGNSDIATNWGIPTDNGANAHSWATDTGVSGTTVGSTTHTAGRQKSTVGFTVPYAGVLVGFYGTGRNHNNSNNMALGLFVGAPEWGNTSTTDYTLRAYGTGSYSGGSGASYKGALKIIDLARSHTLTAGDIIIPAVLETTADKVFYNMTVVIKTLIPT